MDALTSETVVKVTVGRPMSLLKMMSEAHAIVSLGLLHMRNIQLSFVHLKLHPSCDKLRRLSAFTGADQSGILELTQRSPPGYEARVCSALCSGVH